MNTGRSYSISLNVARSWTLIFGSRVQVFSRVKDQAAACQNSASTFLRQYKTYYLRRSTQLFLVTSYKRLFTTLYSIFFYHLKNNGFSTYFSINKVLHLWNMNVNGEILKAACFALKFESNQQNNGIRSLQLQC